MNSTMSSAFDARASTFERYRSLPSGVPEAIRSAFWSSAKRPEKARVLEIGAGTGRIGKVFAEAGDFYVGVDTSYAMLREFSAKSQSCLLAQADGQQLPFGDASFEAVLLMHILNGVDDWRNMLQEIRRVLRPGGSVVVGQTVAPDSGIDARLKRQLATILEEMQVRGQPSRGSRGQQAFAWLDASATRHEHLRASSWNVAASAQEFLLRHRTGARFAALPLAVQEQALDKLRTWAKVNLGSLDERFPESRSFELDIFTYD